GLLASKPYAASGAYIDRMSDYCGTCRYKVKQKAGADACPFNYLYWDFIARHRERLKANPRMAQMVRTWERFGDQRQAEISSDAARFLSGLSAA
ncbi:MAG: cryptochrome/photolyase family protein, partial [Alphaproteobacteria bacterium]|nr:cryptochrome/photolyase family protein [Alphaproteobacteria bacterium]